MKRMFFDKQEYELLLENIKMVEEECKRVNYENKIERELSASWNYKLEVC